MFIAQIRSQSFSSSLVLVNVDAKCSLIDSGIIITTKCLSLAKKWKIN